MNKKSLRDMAGGASVIHHRPFRDIQSESMRNLRLSGSFALPDTIISSGRARLLPSRGFTLIEVLVVLAILSILAGVVTLSIVNRPGEAKVAAAKTQLRALKTAVNLYRTDNNTVPTMQQGLQALITKPTLPPIPLNYPADGYLDTRLLPKDPWKNDFIYLAPGRRGEAFEIITYGSDGQPGGEGDAADISSSDL